MLLSARVLADVADVNRFRIVNQVEARAGSTIDIYFQLIDREAGKELNPPGRRFIPAPNATLSVQLRSVYQRKQVLYTCANPFPEDRSIWKFTVLPTDGKVAPAGPGGPIVDWSNVVPLGEPFDFNAQISDPGMVGTFGLIMTLTENPGMNAAAALNGVAPGDNVTINGVVFTAVAAGATGTQFDVGIDDAATCTNLAQAINNASAVCQVTAAASGTTLTITAVRAASITWTSPSASFVLGSPGLGAKARVTTGWAEQALSISPSFVAV